MASNFKPWGWLNYLIISTMIIVLTIYGGHAVFLTAKAELAQSLLLRAWRKGSATGNNIAAWPWADTYPVALLSAPRQKIEQIVLNSHSGEALAFGPGMIAIENAYVLGGHRDSHFEFLEQLEIGEPLFLEQQEGKIGHYSIDDIFIVDVTESPEYLPPSDSLTLVTCYPFDALRAGGPLRYVVVASLE